jgi:hypothetical protein
MMAREKVYAQPSFANGNPEEEHPAKRLTALVL